MRIVLATLGDAGETFEGSEPATILDLDQDRLFREVGPVAYRLFAELVSHELIVRGRVDCRLEMSCSRCAEFFSTTVKDSAFLRAYEIPEALEAVDITPDLREAVLLNLPAFALCREDCAGLCVRCGANRNLEACGCAPPPDENRWGALDSLNLNE